MLFGIHNNEKASNVELLAFIFASLIRNNYTLVLFTE